MNTEEMLAFKRQKMDQLEKQMPGYKGSQA